MQGRDALGFSPAGQTAAGGAQLGNPARDAARQRAVRLVFGIYLLALLEGSLRKWVAPQLGTYLFFLRDPLLLWVYLVATRYALWPRHSALLSASLVMAGVGIGLFALQALTGGHSDHRLILGVYGWRSYVLYMPLAPLIGAIFNRDDVLRLVRLTLWLAVPIGVLVSAQFFAPPGAPINVGTSEDEALQFRGLTQTAERTRPMGPFASGAGQQQFVGATFATLIALFLAPSRLRKTGLITLAAGVAGLMACIGLSGSRGTVIQCGLGVLAAMTVALVGRDSRLKGRALFWPLALSLAALLAYPVLFPEGYAAFVERWTAAEKVEVRGFGEAAVFGRALFGMVDFLGLIDQVPLLGYGLGFGGNASITLRASIDDFMPGFLAETDFTRHMVDLGPFFGVAFIGFRFVLTAWLGGQALRATRLHADPLPLLLFSYAGLVVGTGQLTGQGTINVFGWLYTGLLLATCRGDQSLSLTTPTPQSSTYAARPFARPQALPGPGAAGGLTAATRELAGDTPIEPSAGRGGFRPVDHPAARPVGPVAPRPGAPVQRQPATRAGQV
jgi:hypothetical protein